MKSLMLTSLKLFALVLSLLVTMGMAQLVVQDRMPLDNIAVALEGRTDSIIIMHFEKPEHPTEDIAGFQWWKNGVPHIMMQPPLNPFDMRFLCIFNHEYAHVVKGAWHGNKSEAGCGPHLLNLELVYPEDTSDTD
jgi:hypothetical protein